MRGIVAAVLVGVTVVSAIPVARAQRRPSYRVATMLIAQTVTVTDRNGNPIEGLNRDDFAVTEDGIPQDIAFVEFQRIDDAARRAEPPSASSPGPSAPRSSASVRLPHPQMSLSPSRDTIYRDRRLLVFYFDCSAMSPSDRARAYSSARKYIETHMTQADMIGIITFQRGAMRVRQDFTDDRAALHEQISRLMSGDDVDGDGIPDDPDTGTAFGPNDAEFNIFNMNRQLGALQTAVTMLRRVAERKALIYFGRALHLNGTENHAQLRATVNAAIKANVTIHAIDAQGLVAAPPLGDARRPSPGGLGTFTGELTRAAMTTTQRSQDTLYALAKDTGGTVLLNYNDLSVGIVDAARTLSSYYIIGYYTRNTIDDGRFHRVQITLTGGRRGELSTRKGYYADNSFANSSTADRERQLEEAFLLENPITDIPVAVEVDYFKISRAEYFVPVAVEIPGSELAPRRRRGASSTSIDFIGEVRDDSGSIVQNVRDKVSVKLDDLTTKQLGTQPVHYQTGFTLLPGTYVLKMLARDAETGRIGTHQTAFTVPNLDREPMLPISSVVLGSQRVTAADAMFTAKSANLHVHPLVVNTFQLIPSVTRVFSRAHDMHVFLEVYQQSTTTQPVVAFASFFNGHDKVMETAPLTITEGLRESSKALPVAFSVPLTSLAPGLYDCQITVLAPGEDKVAFWRRRIAVH